MKTEEDLAALMRTLNKVTVEAALNAELSEHLGYDKHGADGNGSGNSRNGYGRKRLQTEAGPVEIATPRDRAGTFEPQLVKKGQRRVTALDEKVLALYARGMTTREIVAAFKDLYDAEVSASLVSKVTDSVMEEITAWQSRPLDGVFPIVCLDTSAIAITRLSGLLRCLPRDRRRSVWVRTLASGSVAQRSLRNHQSYRLKCRTPAQALRYALGRKTVGRRDAAVERTGTYSHRVSAARIGPAAPGDAVNRLRMPGRAPASKIGQALTAKGDSRPRNPPPAATAGHSLAGREPVARDVTRRRAPSGS